MKAANNLVQRLASAGILHAITGNARNRQFAYGACIDLFHADRQIATP